MTVERLAGELAALLTDLDRAVAATFAPSRVHAAARIRGKAVGRRQSLRGVLLALFGRRKGRNHPKGLKEQ